MLLYVVSLSILINSVWWLNGCVTVNLVVQVTLLVLVHGEYLIPSLKGNTTHVKKVEVKNALETIHSIPRSDLEVSLVSLQ